MCQKLRALLYIVLMNINNHVWIDKKLELKYYGMTRHVVDGRARVEIDVGFLSS